MWKCVQRVCLRMLNHVGERNPIEPENNELFSRVQTSDVAGGFLFVVFVLSGFSNRVGLCLQHVARRRHRTRIRVIFFYLRTRLDHARGYLSTLHSGAENRGNLVVLTLIPWFSRHNFVIYAPGSPPFVQRPNVRMSLQRRRRVLWYWT